MPGNKIPNLIVNASNLFKKRRWNIFFEKLICLRKKFNCHGTCASDSRKLFKIRIKCPVKSLRKVKKLVENGVFGEKATICVREINHFHGFPMYICKFLRKEIYKRSGFQTDHYLIPGKFSIMENIYKPETFGGY